MKKGRPERDEELRAKERPARRASARRRRARHKAEGRCAWCREPEIPGRGVCPKHLEAKRRSGQKWYRQRYGAVTKAWWKAALERAAQYERGQSLYRRRKEADAAALACVRDEDGEGTSEPLVGVDKSEGLLRPLVGGVNPLSERAEADEASVAEGEAQVDLGVEVTEEV